MSKDTSKKPVKKTGKKPVEQQKTHKKEVNVEPKRSAKNKKEENLMANDMVEKNDDKVWVIIAILLVLLIGGAFVANKIINNKKAQESKENKIYVSKDVTSNEDGTVSVVVKVKSKVGIKSVELEDGTVMNFNGKKEVKVEFKADENRDYKLIITDVNGKKTTKKVSISGVNDAKDDDEDEEITVETNNTIYYNYGYNKPANENRPRPDFKEENKKEEEEVKPEPLQFEMDNNLYSANVIIPSVKEGKVVSSKLYKDEVEVEYNFGDAISEDGSYKLLVYDKFNQESEILFTIDTKAPEFAEDYNKVFVENVNVVANDPNLEGYRVTVNGYEKTINDTYVDVENGEYEITAFDKAGNETTVVVTVQEVINDYQYNMIFDQAIILNLNENLEVLEYQLLKQNAEKEFVKVENYNLEDKIEEAGVYRLIITLEEEVKEYNFIIDYNLPSITKTVTENGQIKVDANDENGISGIYYGWNKTYTELQPENIFELPADGLISLPSEPGEYYLWIKAIDSVGKISIFNDLEIMTVAPSDPGVSELPVVEPEVPEVVEEEVVLEK